MLNPFISNKTKKSEEKETTNLSFAEYVQSVVKVKYHDRDYQGPRLESITAVFYTYRFRFDKTQQNGMCLSEDSDLPGHPPSLISLRYLHEESLGLLPPI